MRGKGVAGLGIKAFRSHQDGSIQEVFLSFNCKQQKRILTSCSVAVFFLMLLSLDWHERMYKTW